MEKIVVNDTNIFIDLCDVGLLDEFFQLPWEVHTSDFVINELEQEEQTKSIKQFVNNGRLNIAILSAEELIKIYTLAIDLGYSNKISFEDQSVWYFAKKNNYTLLTGDNRLRKSAQKDGVEVRGILYVFDCLVDKGILSPIDAAGKLLLLKEINSRLPIEEIEHRIKLWKRD